jgi:hypothetical protein
MDQSPKTMNSGITVSLYSVVWISISSTSVSLVSARARANKNDDLEKDQLLKKLLSKEPLLQEDKLTFPQRWADALGLKGHDDVDGRWLLCGFMRGFDFFGLDRGNMVNIYKILNTGDKYLLQ